MTAPAQAQAQAQAPATATAPANMSCLGCQKCEEGPVVTLISGNVVCNTCPEWLLECEARHWVEYARKNGKLKWIEKKAKLIEKRGAEAVKILLDKMNYIRRNSK